ncbi:MAG: hypothetical protein ACKO23_10105 [Gemmataceae bacterium]
MHKPANDTLTLVMGLALIGCQLAYLGPRVVFASDQDKQAPPSVGTAPTTRFLIVCKSKVADPQEQQQRGIDAVRKIAKAAGETRRGAIVDSLAENVTTIQQYRRGQVQEKVTGAIFRDRLRRLTETASAQDTVVLYTHSHGRQNGFEESQPLGGIVLDLPVRKPEHGGALLWDEYADLLLKIPAKNVVVLTMSCFAGGLVEHLDSRSVRDRWKNRRQKEGRNFIVLTSQNGSLPSGPIVKNGELINPFTYAVAQALGGEADGFVLAGGKPVSGKPKDGKLSVGEIIDFILYTTENTESERAKIRNTARPQVTGSFNRSDVLFEAGSRGNSR